MEPEGSLPHSQEPANNFNTFSQKYPPVKKDQSTVSVTNSESYHNLKLSPQIIPMWNIECLHEKSENLIFTLFLQLFIYRISPLIKL
jgi:hypothetical protein